MRISHPLIGAGAALVSFSALGGAVALGVGAVSLGDRLNDRLPFASPVFGAFALAIIVGVPFGLLASWAWNGRRLVAFGSILFGALLVAWLAIELAFIRELSFFHPLFATIGVGFVVAGWNVRRHAPMRADTVDVTVVQRMLALKHVALVGASSDPRKFGNVVFRALRTHGYDVIPVNPRGDEIDGVPCVASIVDLPAQVDWALVMIGGARAEAAVRECVARGITSVWLFRGVGTPGALDEATLELCRRHGIETVPGACPLMFLQPVAAFHNVHRAIRRFNNDLVDTSSGPQHGDQ